MKYSIAFTSWLILPSISLTACAVRFGEPGGERVERAERRGGKRRHFRDRRLARERLQPFDLDQHAVADQRELAEVVAQRGELVVVAAVERGERGKGRERHRHGARWLEDRENLITAAPRFPAVTRRLRCGIICVRFVTGDR